MTEKKRCRVQSRVERQTEFVCPRCGDECDGRVISRQLWGSVFGVPTTMLEQLEDLVECVSCGHHSDLSVLDVPTTAVLAQYIDAATRHAVATVVRSGIRDDGQARATVVDEALAVMERVDRSYGPAALQADIDALDDVSTTAHLALLVEELTPLGKQGLLSRLVRVATADGPLTELERNALCNIGTALQMHAPHITTALIAA